MKIEMAKEWIGRMLTDDPNTFKYVDMGDHVSIYENDDCIAVYRDDWFSRK